MFNLTPPIWHMKIGMSYLQIIKYGTAYLSIHLTATSPNEQTNYWSRDLLLSSQTVCWRYIRNQHVKGGGLLSGGILYIIISIEKLG